MRKTFLGAWIIAVVVLTTFVWLTKTSQSNKHTYYTSVISDSDSPNFITMYGKVLVENETTLVPLAEGNVKKVSVKPGDLVKENQILAILDYYPEDLANYEKLKQIALDPGPIDSLNKSLKDISKLEKSGFYDAVDAAGKRAEIYSSLSQIMLYKSSLQKQYEQTHGKIIRAPFDGIVTDVRLKEGQRVSIRDDKMDVSIFVIPENAPVSVELEVSDEFLSKIKLQQKISVSIPLTEGSSFDGEIKAISHQVYDDKKKRYFKVLAQVSYDRHSVTKLHSGMKIMAEVTAEKNKDWTWIPKAAFDINIDESQVSSRLSFLNRQKSKVFLGKSHDFESSKNSLVDAKRLPSSVLDKASNDVFPEESAISEIYLLTADNKVIKASVQKVGESGEMIAVDTKKLAGMRVITHYEKNGLLW